MTADFKLLALLEVHARPQIYIAATDRLLIENAEDNLYHQSIQNIFVTDTINVKRQVKLQLKTVSIAPLIAQAIRRMSAGNSFDKLK